MAGKKKQTVGYYYFLGMHLAICHGPIDKINAILADEKIAYAGEWTGGQIIFFNLSLFGGDEKEGGIAGPFDLDMGGPTQTPNAYLVSKLAPQLVPAFRGVCSVVCRQIYVGTQTYLKKMGFLATRIHTRTTDGITQWYDAKSQVLAFGPEFILFNEKFQNGLADYTVVTGDIDAYTLTSETYGETLTFDSTGPVVNDIQRTVPTGYFSGVNLKFRLNEYDDGDSATLVFRDAGGNLVFSFIPQRDSAFEAGQRPNVNFVDVSGSYGNPIGPTKVDLGTWYELDISYNQNTGKFDAVITDLSDDSIFGTVSTTVSIGNQIQFMSWPDNEGNVTRGAAASFADIKIKSRLQSSDMNPAHIIRECLTDPDWGMGYQDADVDDTSFQAAADKMFSEGMGMSILWTKQTTIEEFIKEIVKHIDATLYVDKSDGKFHLKLIRDDYDEGDLLTLDPSNIDHIADFTRPSFGELTNSVTVQFWDSTTFKDSSVTVQDIALAQMQGATVNTTVQYPGFTGVNLATRAGQRDLRVLSTPIASCTIYANRDAFALNIGGPFKLTWPDYKVEELVMRVTGVAYGDGKSNRVRLTCTQDVYKMPDEALILPSPPNWEDPNSDPVPATLRLPYEVPYLEAVQQNGQVAIDNLLTADPSIGLAGISVGRPSQATINAHMFVDSGAGYADQATIDFSPTAKLVALLDKSTTSFSISDEAETDSAPNGSWLQIGDEIMVKVSLVAGTLTVKRGALDTVPQEHAANAKIFFWDDFSANDPTQYVSGETVDIKVATVTGKGQLALIDAPTDSLEIVGRAARPYPPAQFQINGAYWPATANDVIDLTWVDRDRLQQTGSSYLGFLDAGVGPEAGTTYNVRIYKDSDDTLLYDNLAIAGTSDLGITLSASTTIRIELESERDSLTSYQKHVHVMEYLHVFNRITENGDTRITENGDIRITE